MLDSGSSSGKQSTKEIRKVHEVFAAEKQPNAAQKCSTQAQTQTHNELGAGADETQKRKES
ncbi:hypothetical protein FPOAC1_000977 [Fusarium poae]|uniref:hypothetical protein n=1 Tax=Fusarium poae TaxID=36050 RepID=UPI001CE843B5|nr:hypothetical protein FPOAC1_000977 [Fusarium poae]KAG8675002.1 hypothetical protein FPOAC1_000977 [Fusarium poae]